MSLVAVEGLATGYAKKQIVFDGEPIGQATSAAGSWPAR